MTLEKSEQEIENLKATKQLTQSNSALNEVQKTLMEKNVPAAEVQKKFGEELQKTLQTGSKKLDQIKKWSEERHLKKSPGLNPN